MIHFANEEAKQAFDELEPAVRETFEHSIKVNQRKLIAASLFGIDSGFGMTIWIGVDTILLCFAVQLFGAFRSGSGIASIGWLIAFLINSYLMTHFTYFMMESKETSYGMYLYRGIHLLEYHYDNGMNMHIMLNYRKNISSIQGTTCSVYSRRIVDGPERGSVYETKVETDLPKRKSIFDVLVYVKNAEEEKVETKKNTNTIAL